MATGVIPQAAEWLVNAIKGVPQVPSQIGSALGSHVPAGPNPIPPGEAQVHGIDTPQGTSNPLSNIGSDALGALWGSSPPPTPAAAPPTSTKTTTGPTLQQMISQAISPMINSLGNTPNGNVAATGPTSYPGQSTVSQDIASNLQVMTSDYKSGLNAMLSTIGTEQPTQSILKGMESLLSYPQGLTGQSGAPTGVEQAPFLQTLYATLNAQRSGLAPPSTATSGSGYNNANSVTNAALYGGQ